MYEIELILKQLESTRDCLFLGGTSCILRIIITIFRIFEQVVKYCHEYGDLIPISFVLGFYVSIVMARWWKQYTTIPFPDSLAVFVSATIHGQVKYFLRNMQHKQNFRYFRMNVEES